MTPIRFTLNGVVTDLDADPELPLLWALRDLLGLTGTKYGCGVGLCGACTIHLDGAAARACQVSLGALGGRSITTIEGLEAPLADPLSDAWLAEDVAQCGYCQPGQIMAAAALLAADQQPDDNAIDVAMSGNLCRCGTYQRIRRAIRRAAGGDNQ